MRLNEFDTAAFYMNKAIGIVKEKLGEKHPSIATLYNNLGNLYIEKKEYEKALTCLEKALEIHIRNKGEEHTSVAHTYYNLANLCSNKLKQYPEAQQYSDKAKEAGFRDIDSVDFDEGTIMVPLLEGVKPDNYEAELTMYGVSYCGGEQKIKVPFTINYASAQMLAQKWDNVIALYNERYNGGYKITAQQWYKNGVPIEGETGTYIHLVGETLSEDDMYSVLLTRDDGVVLFTCDFTPTIKQKAAQTLYRPKEKIQIVEEEALEATIVRINGMVEQRVSLREGGILYAPNEKGVYVLNVQTQMQTIKRKIVVE